MTPDERVAAQKTARIIRASRKLRGWTQIDTAKKIGVSQSALSKLESGVLIPSVHQWFEFCTSAGIPAESHLQGYLDRMETLKLQSRVTQKDFKLKDIYRVDAGSSARSLSPLIQMLQIDLGRIKANKLISEMGVDPDYFVDLGNQINFKFFYDLYQLMLKNGIIKKTTELQLCNQVAPQKCHGNLFANYQLSSSLEAVFKIAFSKSNLYEVNFSYLIEDLKPNSITFSVTPKKHLLENKKLNFIESQEFIHEYRIAYIKKLAQTLETKNIRVQEVVCKSNALEKSIYEVNYSI